MSSPAGESRAGEAGAGLGPRIAHLSDPHFGTVSRELEAALLRDLHERSPDLVLLTGDVTQRARAREFRAARAFLEALPPVPRLVIPGNHDLPLFDLLTRLVNPYRNFRRSIGRELEPSYVDDVLAVLCVDATRATRHKHGAISERQVDRTAERLAALSRPFRVIATHHPLAVVMPSDAVNLARGSARALDRWIAAGADLFLGGHIHLPYCVTVAGASCGRTAVVLQAGTALSRRIRRGVPNSYNLVALRTARGARRMHVERRDFDAATGRFACRRADEGWCGAGGWRLGDPAGS